MRSALLALFILALLAVPAGASTVTASGGIVHFDAANGEANDLNITVDAVGVQLTDPGSTMTLGAIEAGVSCTLGDAHHATCTGNLSDDIEAHLGDDDDQAHLGTDYGTETVVDGGVGDDELFGGDSLATLQGGPGDDEINGGTDDDLIDGGGGLDRLSGGPGFDTITDGDGVGGQPVDADVIDGGLEGGAIDYTARTAPLVVRLGKPNASGQVGEKDSLSGITEVDGGHAADRIIGDNHGNELRGFGGADRIFGRGGADTIDVGAGDRVKGEKGKDTLIAIKPTRSIDCGAGKDRIADPERLGIKKVRLISCETLAWEAVPIDLGNDNFPLSAPARPATTRSGKLKLKVPCLVEAHACDVRVTVRFGARVVARKRLTVPARSRAVAAMRVRRAFARAHHLHPALLTFELREDATRATWRVPVRF